MNICIVGTGLLGGSFALGLKASEKGHFYTGVDANSQHTREALRLGIIDKVGDFEQAIPDADLVVLATPVDALLHLLPQCLDLISDDAVVIDLGSTKSKIIKTVESHPKRGRYVACHPIAGTEHSGPESAFESLLKDQMMIICDQEFSDPDALELVKHTFNKIGMKIHFMDGATHDKHIAYVSHLSHISSFALGLTVLDKEQIEESIFNMAGSGFSSTVRLAKSSPEMWAPILLQNEPQILEALDQYIRELEQFRALIAGKDAVALRELMARANGIKRVLKEM